MGRFSISMNKRELEKKRAQKRKEKQKRKEERKSNNVDGSQGNMIAYVDKYGNITNTKPDPEDKQEIKAANIATSTPKKQEEEELNLKGRVEHYKKDKGYGFIKDIISSEKYFFHITDAFPHIAEGAMVSYNLGKRNRGLNAINIEPTK